MPLTSSATDIAVHKLIKDTSTYYRSGSTNSKPMHRLERLFILAISDNKIRTNIMDYILKHIKDYE